MLKQIIVFLFSFIFPLILNSQEKENESPVVLQGEIIDGDTIPFIHIEEVLVYAKIIPKNFYQKWKYNRLIRNIKRVYPYSKLAKRKFEEMNNYYLSLETAKEKRVYMNTLEKEILKEFGDELKNLTISQGRLLIKLIDRETGHTSYDILKDYKGSLSAFFWQTLAKMFGSNLKSTYDGEGDDEIIEKFIFLYEQGLL